MTSATALMPLTPDNTALFDMLRDEAVPPAAMNARWRLGCAP